MRANLERGELDPTVQDCRRCKKAAKLRQFTADEAEKGRLV